MTDYSKMTTDEIVAEKERREKARSEGKAAREREISELELRFEDELGGPRGVAFAIVNVPESAIVVKLGPATLFKRWNGAKREKDTGLPSLEVTSQFVSPCVVYPDAAKFTAIVDKRHAVIVACANMLAALYQGDEEAASGKY